MKSNLEYLTKTTTWINSNCFTYTIKMKRANRVKRIYPYWKTISQQFQGSDIYIFIAVTTLFTCESCVVARIRCRSMLCFLFCQDNSNCFWLQSETYRKRVSLNYCKSIPSIFALQLITLSSYWLALLQIHSMVPIGAPNFLSK